MFDWQIIGHSKITHLLESAINNDALSHAYLFHGPKSIGVRTLIKKFILNLMCYNDDPTKPTIPCHECDHCRQIEKNIHPDIIWIKKEKDKKDITVEQIRELQDKLAVHSFFKNYKIAVIENADQMNLASANALLKTLEEPTAKTIIILTSQHITQLPKTILSRVQSIKLLPVPTKEIYDHLISQPTDREHARHLANLAFGRPGRALTFLHYPPLWDAYLAQLKIFFELFKSSRVQKIKFAEKILASEETLVQKTEKLIPLLNLWQLILRDLILHKIDQNDKIINTSASNSLTQIKNKHSLLNLINLQKFIRLTKIYLSKNVNPRLALENLLLKI